MEVNARKYIFVLKVLDSNKCHLKSFQKNIESVYFPLFCDNIRFTKRAHTSKGIHREGFHMLAIQFVVKYNVFWSSNRRGCTRYNYS